MAEASDSARSDAALATPVHDGERYVAFGELTLDQVRAQADRIGDAGNWGPLQRAAAVAREWRRLADAMDEAGADRVSELGPSVAVDWAERTWVIPPAEGMI
jgi:hypothetical protein